VGFEICSWLVNRCKADTTPEEFVAQCKQIVAFRAKQQTNHGGAEYTEKRRFTAKACAEPVEARKGRKEGNED
jgi:hypothetical protein